MFTAELAGHAIGIENKYEYIRKYYSEYITERTPEFIVSATEEEIASENRTGGSWNSSYLETLAIYRKICENLLEDNIILFHSSALMINGKAILFTAPSGTGKSTHASLWRKKFSDRVTMINDDKPLLRLEEQITVYGTPYGGKDNIHTNTSAEVSAIVILHQAVKNTIKKIDSDDAFPTLLNQTYRCDTIEGMTKTLQLVDRLSRLPIYSLGCTISEEAVDTVYNAVFGN